MNFVRFPGGEFSKRWCCKPFCLPSYLRGAAPEKISNLKSFQLHLMTSKWDQERVRLAIYPSQGKVEYLNHNEWKIWQIYGLKWKSESRIISRLSANFTKWSNTLKQFVGNFPTNCLSLFDNFVKLALKGLDNTASFRHLLK